MKRNLSILLCIAFCLSATAQVDLPSGAATYSLPIYTLSTPSRLSTSVSINYIDGSGLRTSEIGGEVGTGWNLDAGGVITREQRGLPDDQRKSLSYANPTPDNANMTFLEYYTKYFPNGYLFTSFNPFDNMTNEAAYQRMFNQFYYMTYDPYGNIYYPGNRKTPVPEYYAADREQDVFTLDYGKGKTRFIIDKLLQVHVLDDSKVKIQFAIEDMLSQGIRTCISKFVVIDEEGIQYTFAQKELTELLVYNRTGSPNFQNYGFMDLLSNDVYSITPAHATYGNASYQYPVSYGRRLGIYSVSKWHLTKIENPLIPTSDPIIFSYTNYDINLPNVKMIHSTHGSNTGTVIGETLLWDYLKANRLDKISYGTSEIKLNYENSPRADIPDLKPIKEIEIWENGTFAMRYLFNYQYFFASVLKPYNYNFSNNEKFITRLCLQSIKKFSSQGVTEPVAAFDYYTGTTPENSIHFNGPLYDGGYDIVPPMFTLLSDHWGYYNANNSFNYDNLTERPYNYGWIYYPITDALKNPVPGKAKNGILKKVTNGYGGTITYSYEQNTVFSNNQTINVGGVRVSQVVKSDEVNQNNNTITNYKYVKSDGVTSSGWGYETPVYTLTTSERVYSAAQGLTAANYFQQVGSTALSVGLTMPVGPHVFSSVLGNIATAAAGAIVTIVIDLIIASFTPSPPEFTEQLVTSTQNFPLQSVNPLPSSYSRIEIAETSPQAIANGKMVFDFTSETDYPLDVPVLTFPFSKKPRLNESLYGLAKKVATYDNTNFLLKETTNTYQFTDQIEGISADWDVNQKIADKYPSDHMAFINSTTVGSGLTNVVKTIYDQRKRYYQLASTTDKIYSKTSPGVITNKIDYTYSPINNQVKTIRATNSKQQILETRNYYPGDYNGNVIFPMQTLVNYNAINIPVSKETWQINPGGTNKLLSLEVSEMGYLANGDVKMTKKHALETQEPILENVIGVFDPNTLIRNTSFIKPIFQFEYDIKGNQSVVKDLEGDRVTNFLNSKQNNQPLANITNASLSEIAYTSFEDNDVLNPNITWSPYTILPEPSPTGDKCGWLSLGNNTIQITIPVQKESILSFWTTSDDFQINGTTMTPSIKGPTINGWTFYEFNIPQGATSPSITGNCHIDEIRFHPKNSKMMTATYVPGIGKTSECDQNNRITYFEYDGFGRLVRVFDAQRNLIKTYEYHFKTQP